MQSLFRKPETYYGETSLSQRIFIPSHFAYFAFDARGTEQAGLLFRGLSEDFSSKVETNCNFEKHAELYSSLSSEKLRTISNLTNKYKSWEIFCLHVSVILWQRPRWRRNREERTNEPMSSYSTEPEIMVGTWLGECIRQVEAEEVSNSRNKIHQTTYKDFFRAVYLNMHG